MITASVLRRLFQRLVRHPWLHLISLSTTTATLLLLGLCLMCYRNFKEFADRTNPQQLGTVYLKAALPTPAVRNLKESILSEAGVARVSFRSKQSVITELQGFLGGEAGSPADLTAEAELFPDVLEIELEADAKPLAVGALKSKLAKLPEVADIDFSEDWLLQYRRAERFLKVAGISLLFVIFIGSSLILANFMGMRHQSRRQEIDIVQLMGANRTFILVPFVVEGVFEALVASIAAVGLLFSAKVALARLVLIPLVPTLSPNSIHFLSGWQILLVTATAFLMALFSAFSVFLRFRERRTA